MAKINCPYIKGKTYYEAQQDFQIKFVEEKIDHTYVFKIIGHPIWDEFETRDVSNIYANKTSYEKELITQQKQQVTEVMIDM